MKTHLPTDKLQKQIMGKVHGYVFAAETKGKHLYMNINTSLAAVSCKVRYSGAVICFANLPSDMFAM